MERSINQKFRKICFLLSIMMIGNLAADDQGPNAKPDQDQVLNPKMFKKSYIKKALKYDVFMSPEERIILYQFAQEIKKKRREHRKERLKKFFSGLNKAVLKTLDIVTNPTILNLISPGNSSNNHLPRS